MNKYLELQDKLCQAMEMFAENAVNKAGFDRTIQATIINCVDESIGRYKVQYQDSMFYAYAQNDENKYSSGTGVYVLIQNNDMARDKFIIGTVDKLGMDYLSITDESDRYEKIGTNCLNFPNEIQLCSYLKEDSYLINTNSGYIQNNELLTYIKDAECLLIQMDIQTALDQIQRRKGDYGLEIELIFKNELNENANNIIRKYIVNINQMTGNPYLYIDKTPQLFAISIDNENFLGIKSIKAFSKDFPKEKNEMPKDIFFSNLAIYAANRLDESELNTLRLTIHSPLGLVFSDKVPKLSIEAIVRTGNEVTTGMDYYWFVEDASVTSQSDDFLILGGQGWKCLNFYDIIETEDEEVKEWKPDINTKIFNIDNQLAEQVKYKCVAVKGEEILNKEFILYNSLAQYKIELISDKGTTFYNGVGSPVLTCKVTKDNILSTDCSYVWTYIDKNNILTLMSDIDNKITVDISSIDDFNIYQCSVYKDNFFIGSAEITLLNKKGTEGTYNLVINNGTRAYIYNEEGISPASNNVINPITILPLSFTLFDNNGQQFDEEILASLDFSWKVPAENTLLKVDGGELIDGYYYFRGAEYLQLNYKIASTYSIRKNNNQIELIVKYKDLILKAATNFIFIKEGEVGTNGTGVVASITALDCSEDEEPMWYAYEEDQVTFSNYSQLEFTLQSYVGILIQTLDNEYHSDVQWQILLNKNKVIDSTYLQYDSDAGVTHRGTKSGEESIGDIVLAQASANGKKYYVAFPMPTAMIRNTSADFIPYLKKGSGCRSVLYAADGTNPRYNNEIPFEIGLKDGNGKDLAIDDYEFTWFTESEYITLRTEDLEKNQCSIYPSEIYDGRSVTIALECFVTYGDIEIDVHIPIYFYLNTYGYNELNDWNGNSLEINEDGGYILTPQVGAGIKNSDNTFTGLLMGKVKLNSDSNEKIGLIGLYNGIQTIFLDSKTGKAEFGRAGGGQIILDPSTDQAIIKSGNFNTTAKTGMQINLTEPSIIFGSGNFSVDSTGKLKASNVDLTGKITAEEGFLGGWSISKGGITYDSTNYTVHVLTGTNNNKDFLVVHDKATDTWPFFVRADGTFVATKASITGAISATSGTIGGITLNENYGLYTNGKTTSNSTSSGFLIQKNGNIYLGPYANGHCPIELNASGNLYAINGTIGCWTMNANQMYSSSAGVNKDSNAGMAFWAGGSLDSTHKGNNASFRVSHDGSLYADKVNLTGNITANEFYLQNELGIGGAWDNGGFTIYDAVTSSGAGYGVTLGVWCPPIGGIDESAYLSSNSLLIEQSKRDGNIDEWTYFTISMGTDYETDGGLVGEVYFGGYLRSDINIYYDMFEVNYSESRNNALLNSQIIYNETTDAGSNVRISTNGYLMRYKASSSQRYKHNIQNLNLNEIYGLYNVPVRTFIYNLDYLNKDSERYNKAIPGLIAEEVAAVNDLLVDHNEDGSIEMWNNNILVPCMLKLIQHNHEEINDLKQQVKQLQAKLDNI